MTNPWTLTWAANFVSKWEGFSAKAYWDSIGNVWTIGYGHTGPDVYKGEIITQAKGIYLLTKDLRSASRAIAQHITVPLSYRQRIALISLVFNCGPGCITNTHLQHALNHKHYLVAADRFLDWCHDGNGNVIEGLLRRRQAERRLFLKGTS